MEEILSNGSEQETYYDIDSEEKYVEESSRQINDMEVYDDQVPVQMQSTLRKSQRTRKPKNFGNDFLTYLAMSDNFSDPINIEQALNRSDHCSWLQAMRDEIYSLKKSRT